MRIVIDASRAVNEKAGISRYTFQVIKNLLLADRENTYNLFYTFMHDEDGLPIGRQSQKQKIIAELESLNPRVKSMIFRIPGAWKEKLWGWQKLNLLDLVLGKQDILFAPSFFEIHLASRIPAVVTIHDLTMFKFPEQRGKTLSQYLASRTLKACQKAQKILSVSENTKKDLIEILKIKPEKIIVTPLACAEEFSLAVNADEIKKIKTKYNLAKKIILSVGTLEPRKNMVRLISAYAELPKILQKKYDLVIAGGAGWNNSDILTMVQALGLQEKVKFLGFVPDADLNLLYHTTEIFVYPAIYEGFGLPVLEAITAGAPVITSNTSSLPEVGGKAVLYVDPLDVSDIVLKIKNLLENPRLRTNLIKKGKIQAQKFSWEKTVRKTLGVFEQFKTKSEKRKITIQN